MIFQQIKILMLTSMFVLTIAACQNKPSVDKSVDYKNARSIPSLDSTLKTNSAGSELGKEPGNKAAKR